MQKIILTVYMLLLFIFSATADHKHTSIRPVEKKVVIVKPNDQVVVVKKDVRVRHRHLHRREVRVERRINRVHNRRHRNCH